MMALAMLIFMFSMAGIPPLAGFWGKLYIFMAAVEAKLFWPAVLGVLASVVASYYYLRIVKVMYFDEGTEALDQPVVRRQPRRGLRGRRCWSRCSRWRRSRSA